MGHLIEVFVVSCPLCQEAVEVVKELRALGARLKYMTCIGIPQASKKARRYGVRALPAVVVYGKNKFEGVPSLEKLKEALSL